MANEIPEGWRIVSTPDEQPPPAGAGGGAGAETPPSMSQTRAGVLGWLTGASGNFSDEVYGLSKASGLPDWLGGFRAPVGAGRMLAEQLAPPPRALPATAGGYEKTDLPVERGKSPFMSVYEEAVAKRRAENKQAEAEYPGTYLTGQIAGGVVLPGGAAAQAATLPVRMGRGAVLGSVYGGLSGAGAGETPIERLAQGATGALVGGAIGGVAPAAVEVALSGGGRLLAPFTTAVRGAVDAPREARRLVGANLGAGIRTDPTARTRLTPGEFATDVAAGGPAAIMDLGGEPLLRLGRTAINVSPEAHGILNQVIDRRFENQSTRVADRLRSYFNYPNKAQQKEAFEQAAVQTNTPAYRQAYAAGSGSIPLSPELTNAPQVVEAMKVAAKNAEFESAIRGHGAMNPRVTVTPDGRVIFNKGPSGIPTYPDLQFWDLTRRELDSAYKRAKRAGDDTEAGRLAQAARMMNAELDAVVPEYAAARSGAAHFFGAENALDAGEKYFGKGINFGTTRAALRAKSEMTPLERQMFEDTYADKLIHSVGNVGARQSILSKAPHFAGLPNLQEEMVVGLGRPGAATVEGIRRSEGIMERARNTLQGGPTTARQLIDSGALLGYGASAGVLGTGMYNQDPHQMLLGGIAGALTSGGRRVNANVMREVADILASQNPSRIISDRAGPIVQNPSVLRGATTQAIQLSQQQGAREAQRQALTRALLERAVMSGTIPSALSIIQDRSR
jgi:hypothetical protein